MSTLFEANTFWAMHHLRIHPVVIVVWKITVRRRALVQPEQETKTLDGKNHAGNV
jgi:hypothetical protein